MTNKKRIAALIGATLLFSMPACSSQRLDEATNLTPAPETEEVVAEEVVEEETVPSTTKYVLTGATFTDNERKVLEFLQARGITDKVALATVMGNIMQESRFYTNICEGGARVNYENCYTGGFGLIQWTTPSRYDGLGRNARVQGLNPSTLEAQLDWMVKEQQWQRVEGTFKTPGLSRGTYMNAAYKWLGWGVHGSRSHYTSTYINHLSEV